MPDDKKQYDQFELPDWAKVPAEKPVRLVYTDALVAVKAELAGLLAASCDVKLDIAFIAAEMLMHLGRGQMAAQLGKNYSETSTSDLTTLMNEADIFKQPATPNHESTAESLFLGFVKSIAHNDPALKKQRWKTLGGSDLKFIGALSFLVGNLAWQNKAGATMTRDEVRAAFELVKAAQCPSSGTTAGGGPFCDWVFL